MSSSSGDFIVGRERPFCNQEWDYSADAINCLQNFSVSEEKRKAHHVFFPPAACKLFGFVTEVLEKDLWQMSLEEDTFETLDSNSTVSLELMIGNKIIL